MKTRIFFAAIAAAALFALAAQAHAQYAPYAPYAPYPAFPAMSKMKISIEPILPVGPAIDSDEGGMYGGLQGGFGYHFVDKRFISIGVDGKMGYAIPVVKKWNSYYEHSGSWITMNFGLPMRFGGRTGFFFRPGLCFEIFDHTVHGYDPVKNETWHVEFNSSFAFGASLALGPDFQITSRVSLGMGINIDYLIAPHDGRTDWYTGTVPVTHHYGSVTGRLTVMGFAKITIGI